MFGEGNYVSEKSYINNLPIASLVAQTVKRLPTTQETRVQSLGQEDPLEKEWQPTPVLLPGKSHGRRSLVGYSLLLLLNHFSCVRLCATT